MRPDRRTSRFRRSVISVTALSMALLAGVARAQSFELLHSFNFVDGADPDAALIQAPDGNLYGMTNTSASFYGTVFKVDALGAVTTLHFFTGTDGASPFSRLCLAADGKLYGTTTYGGSLGYGTLFKADTLGGFTSLHFFAMSDGAFPGGGLIQATDGNFYGTTMQGGASNGGTVFRMDASSAVTTLHSFSGSDGRIPYAGLIQATDGSFYGTTYTDSARGYGTVFKVDASGAFTKLHSFTGSDGANPHVGGLIQALDGSFCGTTYGGGAGGYGTVFRMDESGAFTTLHSFTGSDGAHPTAGVIQALDGNIYGTTYQGGASGYGTVFKMDGSGALTTIHSFTGSQGANPIAGLVQTANGDFYGTTQRGGANGNGTVYRLSFAPRLTVTKVVVNDDGGTKSVSDFPLFVDGSPVVSEVPSTLAVGLHRITEASSPGYAATITGDCASDGSIALNPGDVKTCTITNDDLAARPVAIRIKDGHGIPALNPRSQGVTPVAVLSTGAFDAPASIDPGSLTFGRTGLEKSLSSCHVAGEDVNGDGLADLLCFFHTRLTEFRSGNTEGFLRGFTFAGVPISGSGALRIVPK